MSFANTDSLTSSFPICSPFIPISSLIAVDRTSISMLNISCKSGHPCLISDLRGNAFSFSPLSMMLAVGLLHVAFIILSYVPSLPTFRRVFIINRYCTLSKAFSVSMEMIIWFLFFNLFISCIILIDL